MLSVIQNARVLMNGVLRDVLIVYENGVLIDFPAHMDIPAGAAVTDARGLTALPGMVDIHVHGGGGYTLMTGKPGDVLSMALAHARHGTTSIVPTTLAAPQDQLLAAASAVRAAMAQPSPGARVLGLHLEGPCLSPLQSGAQAPDALCLPSDARVAALLAFSDVLCMMGIAPELPGAFELGDRLRARGVPCSVAHSNAAYAVVREAMRHGFCDVTHLYSCCSTITREKGFRVPGVVEAGLNEDGLTVQVIADGCHLPPELLSLIWRCKGPDGMYAVTDGLEASASDMAEGTVYTQQNGVKTVYEDGVMKLMDRTAFAGSAAGMDRLLRTLCAAGIPLAQAARMTGEIPARRVNRTDIGVFKPGARADIALLDAGMQTRATLVNGAFVFSDPTVFAL